MSLKWATQGMGPKALGLGASLFFRAPNGFLKEQIAASPNDKYQKKKAQKKSYTKELSPKRNSPNDQKMLKNPGKMSQTWKQQKLSND
eukprot:4115082-Amphidinium_carterae.1